MRSPVIYLPTIPDSGTRLHAAAVVLWRWIRRAVIFAAGFGAGAAWWASGVGAWL